MYREDSTYYDILNVKENASQDEIKSAMIEYLLSPSQDQDIDSKKREAYRILSDPESKKKYDELLENNRKNFRTYSYFSSSNEPDPFINPKAELHPIRPPRKPVEDTVDVEDSDFLDEEPKEETKEQREKREPIRPPRKPVEDTVDVEDSDFLDEEPVEESELEEPQTEYPKIISQFSPNEQNKKFQNSKISKIGKKFGGVLVPFAVGIIPITTAMLGIISPTVAAITALTLVPTTVWLRKRKKKLIKDKKVKKISKITSEEMRAYENYQIALDKELNKLLSETHDNYKLTLLKAKYERQKVLLEKIYEIRANTKTDQSILKYKLDLISIKMQIEEISKSISKIEEQLKETVKTGKLTELNKQLEKDQEKIDSYDKRSHITIQKLKIKKRKDIKKRNRFAKLEKFKIVKQMSVYEKFLKAKAFVRTVGYLSKPEDEIDEFLMEESETTSKSQK